MKRFKFRLQRVLEHKEVVRGEARREVMLKNRELSEAQQRLLDLRQAQASNGLIEEGEVSTASIFLSALFGQRLKREIGSQVEAITKAEEAVEVARNAYVEAAKEAQSLLTLKQRRLDEYKEYAQKEDLKFLDELTVQKGNTMRREIDEAARD